MKAWIVENPSWCTLVHAGSRGKAIVSAMEWVANDYDYIEFRARRLPELDNKPFTYKDCLDAGFEYQSEYGVEPEETFSNDCYCDICRIARRTR